MPDTPDAKPAAARKKKRPAARRNKKSARRKAAPAAAKSGSRRAVNFVVVKVERRKPVRRVAPNRSEFLRGLLAAAPDTSLAAARAAWRAAGHRATLAGSIFYMVRGALGHGGRRSAPRPVRATPAPAGFAHIERELDRLVALAPDPQIAELLRAARRRASLALLQRR